jgi:spore coat polysaccharide biosynthesis predicted glycosyltransferase SpsG
VLFVVAAGPRAGFGHLVRARSLARVLGVPALVIVRGTAATRRRAASGGWQVISAADVTALQRLAPDVLVVDDPSIVATRAWVRRARRAGIPVATLHDLGITATESDLVIDGTVKPNRRVRGDYGTLHGPAYAILDPAIRALREQAPRPDARRILIALGGGHYVRSAARVAAAIGARLGDDVDIRVAGGFAAPRLPALLSGCWIDARSGLAAELAAASVAVLAGGVTLYEACALGVPTVAVPVNAPQRVTIRAIAREGAAVDGSGLSALGSGQKIALALERLLGDAAARRRMSRAGKKLVDGRGAFRVAARLRALPSAMASRIDDVA